MSYESKEAMMGGEERTTKYAESAKRAARLLYKKTRAINLSL
jgi:hypothetical protein